MNVLIVEDDDNAADTLTGTLGGHGYQVYRTAAGGQAVDLAPSAHLVLLALELPDLHGYEVCRRIREQSCVPVIVLSGRTAELDRVMAFHMGADDFMAKPLSRYELLARIQAILRRAGGCPQHGGVGSTTATSTSPVTFLHGIPSPTPPPSLDASPQTESMEAPARTSLSAGPLRLDPRARRVYLNGSEVRVTRREFDLLTMLLEEPGTVMQRQEIMNQVWDENWFGSTRTLDVHVGSLRSKLGNPKWIEAVRGVGYRLTVPQDSAA